MKHDIWKIRREAKAVTERSVKTLVVQYVSAITGVRQADVIKNADKIKLSDFNKLYLEDTCETQQYTSLNRAFKLQPYIESKGKINIEEGISKYNKNSRNFQNLDFDFNI